MGSRKRPADDDKRNTRRVRLTAPLDTGESEDSVSAASSTSSISETGVQGYNLRPRMWPPTTTPATLVGPSPSTASEDSSISETGVQGYNLRPRMWHPWTTPGASLGASHGTSSGGIAGPSPSTASEDSLNTYDLRPRLAPSTSSTSNTLSSANSRSRATSSRSGSSQAQALRPNLAISSSSTNNTLLSANSRATSSRTGSSQAQALSPRLAISASSTNNTLSSANSRATSSRTGSSQEQADELVDVGDDENDDDDDEDVIFVENDVDDDEDVIFVENDVECIEVPDDPNNVHYILYDKKGKPYLHGYESKSKGDCPICLETLNSWPCPMVIPSCGHPMCIRCLQKMIKRGSLKCPVCRATMEEAAWKCQSRTQFVRRSWYQLLLVDSRRDALVEDWMAGNWKLEV